MGSTNINGSDVWDDPEYKIPMPFNFKIFDTPLGDTLCFLDLFGGGEFGSYPDDEGLAIFPYGADLIDRGEITGISQSPISYLVDGTAPDRVLKIEYKNAGFYAEADSLFTTKDFVNFQLWLHETSGTISMHYGPNLITDFNLVFDEENGPLIGVGDSTDGIILLEGSANNPTATLKDDFTTIIGTPANGAVYTFKRSTTNLNKVSSFGGKIFPNPVSDYINVSFDNLGDISSIKIININGKIIFEQKDIIANLRLNTMSFPSGVYSILVGKNDGTLGVKKFIKE